VVFRFLTYIYLWVNSRSCPGSARSLGNNMIWYILTECWKFIYNIIIAKFPFTVWAGLSLLIQNRFLHAFQKLIVYLEHIKSSSLSFKQASAFCAASFTAFLYFRLALIQPKLISPAQGHPNCRHRLVASIHSCLSRSSSSVYQCLWKLTLTLGTVMLAASCRQLIKSK